MKVKLLNKKAKLPTRGSNQAAGLDLFCCEKTAIQPGERKLLSTGVSMEIPYGYAGLIWPRSKLANKVGIQILAGVIDSDYRGEVMVLAYNSGTSFWDIEEGEAVAQILVQKIDMESCVEVEGLSTTLRDSSGISSEALRKRI